jgi:hypothetical protein
MKANELRIGNLVEKHYKLHNETKRFDNIGYLDIANIYMNIGEIGYNPILLTEEWLLKLGFKKFCKDYAKKGIILHTRKRGFIIRKSVPQMDYVHQLQNLYFALTGEELTIK